MSGADAGIAASTRARAGVCDASHRHARGPIHAHAEFDLSRLRPLGAVMLAAGVVLPLLGHPGPGCILRAVTGIPCPLCGMSTSVEATVRGRLDEAFAANPMGIVAVVVALVLLVRPGEAKLRVPMWAVLFTLVGMWAFQLARFSVI